MDNKRDYFENKGLSAGKWVEVTPDDNTDLPFVPRFIAFGTVGDLAMLPIEGNQSIIPSGVLVAGCLHPLSPRRILATGTTATDIWAFV